MCIQTAKTATDLGRLFHLRMSGIAYEQLQIVFMALEDNSNMDEHA